MSKKIVMTAVKWLKKELEEYGSSSHLNLDWTTFDELCEQASKIQEQQILNDYHNGIQEGIARNISTSLFIPKTPEQYYNETYK